MKLTLRTYNAQNIKRARHICRHNSHRQSLTLRNGQLYTMRYNPGIQPRTESQEKSWSIFKEANRLATADFHNPSRKAYWHNKLKSQTKYKTARGLAKAFYIALLKHKMSAFKANHDSDSRLAAHSLRPVFTHNASKIKLFTPAKTPKTWIHYRNILCFRYHLSAICQSNIYT